jgi:hypothetical protein
VLDEFVRLQIADHWRDRRWPPIERICDRRQRDWLGRLVEARDDRFEDRLFRV